MGVFALATPFSISRPWIYWETGIGSVLSQVVIIRVGISVAQLPGPLDAFTSYDGLAAQDGGMGELLDKFALQLGMKLPPVLKESVVNDWLQSANAHKPEESTLDDSQVRPEQLSKLDTLISRLEVALATDAPTWLQGSGVTPLSSLLDENQPSGLARARTRRMAGASLLPRSTPPNDDENAAEREATKERVLGSEQVSIIESVEHLREVLSNLPPETKLRARPVDEDGDIPVWASRLQDQATFWLRGEAMTGGPDLIASDPHLSGRFSPLADQVSRVLERGRD